MGILWFRELTPSLGAGHAGRFIPLHGVRSSLHNRALPLGQGVHRRAPWTIDGATAEHMHWKARGEPFLLRTQAELGLAG